MNDRLDPIPFLPGLFYGMPAATYHAIEAISATGSKHILRSPQHYKLARTTPSVPTAPMQLGSAVHTGVLEPDLFTQSVACAPECDKRTKAGKVTWDAFGADNVGKVILDGPSFQRAEACIDAVRAHPGAAKLLDGAHTEVSLFWNDAHYGCPCKSRYDIYSQGGITDLKTCQDASPDGFGRTIASFLYHMAAAFYISGAEHVLNESPQFFCFIAVETEPPHAVAVYRLPGNAVMAGAHLVNRALERYAEALRTGEWRGYPSTIEDIQLPRWALRFDQ